MNRAHIERSIETLEHTKEPTLRDFIKQVWDKAKSDHDCSCDICVGMAFKEISREYAGVING